MKLRLKVLVTWFDVADATGLSTPAMFVREKEREGGRMCALFMQVTDQQELRFQKLFNVKIKVSEFADAGKRKQRE